MQGIWRLVGTAIPLQKTSSEARWENGERLSSILLLQQIIRTDWSIHSTKVRDVCNSFNSFQEGSRCLHHLLLLLLLKNRGHFCSNPPYFAMTPLIFSYLLNISTIHIAISVDTRWHPLTKSICRYSFISSRWHFSGIYLYSLFFIKRKSIDIERVRKFTKEV